MRLLCTLLIPSGPDGRVQAAQGSSTEDAKFQRRRRSWEGAAAVSGAKGTAHGASQQPVAAHEAEGVVLPENPREESSAGLLWVLSMGL